jgi:hypothetical protein
MILGLPWNPEGITALATLFGAILVLPLIFLAWRELRQSANYARTSFEDQINKEYRDIARELPVSVFFGSELKEKEYREAFPILYRYIDLSNEQVFLRQRGRVGKETWEFWCDGISSNLQRHAFSRAWAEIKDKADPSFVELRKLEASFFEMDPYVAWWQFWRK